MSFSDFSSRKMAHPGPLQAPSRPPISPWWEAVGGAGAKGRWGGKLEVVLWFSLDVIFEGSNSTST